MAVCDYVFLMRQDAWQSDGQGNQIHNCAESYGQHNIYPPGTYVANNACQNQPAGYYNVNSTPGTQQDTWHTEVHGTGLYNATAYPEQGSHLPNAVVSTEGCTHGPSYSNFTYQTAYQQEPWHTTYANADGTHHIQGAPEQTSYCAGGVAGANVGQTAGYPNNDHPYLVQSLTLIFFKILQTVHKKPLPNLLLTQHLIHNM